MTSVYPAARFADKQKNFLFIYDIHNFRNLHRNCSKKETNNCANDDQGVVGKHSIIVIKEFYISWWFVFDYERGSQS